MPRDSVFIQILNQNMDQPILRVNNLSIAFQQQGEQFLAVEHLSFDLRPARVLAVVGESGSGKSVTSFSLMQLLSPKTTFFPSGEFIFHFNKNQEVLEPASEEIASLRGKKIAMIFQEPMTALNPVMRCGEQVAEMMRLHLGLSQKEANRRVIELFSEVLIPDPHSSVLKYPHQLSGGQRQRVMIAMAISCNPEILIADEPTTALDPTVQKEILSLLHRIQKKHHTTILFITHDLGLVKEFADDILVMKSGMMMEFGPAAAVLSNPQSWYTKALLNCKPRPGVKTAQLPTINTLEIKPQNIVSVDSGNQPVLSVKNLSKVYVKRNYWSQPEKFVAVDNVSLYVNRGETLGLVGESGCGKSTLSRMIVGLIQPTSGWISFPRNENEPRSEVVQLIFQDPYSALNPRKKILETLVEPMLANGIERSRKLAIEKAVQTLKSVELKEDDLFKYPHQFSGGQRQRIVIARALCMEPKIIICDESVAALDVSVQAQVLNLLNALKYSRQLSYLFISHDLAVVYHMSDRIAVMERGKFVEMGNADDVFFRPQSNYTKSLLKAIPGYSPTFLD